MSERDIRIGDAEREQALELLGTHLGEGRLSVDEYGERSARVATAKTRGDLYGLFSDLPAPRPRFTQVEPLVTPDTTVRRTFQLDPRATGTVVMAVALLSVLLFFVVKTPFVFLFIPAAMLLVGRMGRR
ncbi:hypothetical protein ALI22I_35540 [Saccharothrix sp. ALI-22-I]|uniref:DUF1707 SHOCT-like domain-containing protein n=1 Tax=Saccharothrix sp. ALI-22-I TaxID=1933778 RepID=UPI00097BF33B|nr:DUF1707 domain-containing protein [Saccharothrix sp. ALI-22-I]ONI83767.1 hypothetical protein ALI22I_35540 [Saccharothrix sp. ALI-22-I]